MATAAAARPAKEDVFLAFSKPSLELDFQRYLLRCHDASERAGLAFVAVSEWAFLRMVVETRGVWSLGALLQFFLLVLPTTAVSYCRIRVAHQGPSIMVTTVKVCYLPVCLALANFRNPEADQHPWHILDADFALVRYFGNCVCMPIGALVAPGLLGHLVMVFCTPQRFRNHIKCVFLSTVLCIFLNTSFTARLLMDSPLSRRWVLKTVGLLESVSGSIVSFVNFGEGSSIPVLYPCQLWWCALSIFQCLLSSSYVWLAEVRARENFFLEKSLVTGNPINDRNISGQVHTNRNHSNITVSPKVFCVLSLFGICLVFSVVWEVCKVAMWELNRLGWDYFLCAHESWESLLPQWREDGVLQLLG